MRKRALRRVSVALWLIALLVATGVQAAPATLARLAAADPVIRFSPSSVTVASGASFAIDVVVDNVVDLGAFEFTVAFDPGVVQVQNVALTSFLGSTGRTVVVAPDAPKIDNVAGTVKYVAFSFGSVAGPNGTGTVAQITLQAIGSGNSTSLAFTAAQLPNTQGVVQTPLTMVSGLVTVSGAVATHTATAVNTPTPTRTRTPTEPPSSTWTPTPTATVTLRPSPTPTWTEVPTLTHTPVVPTATATETATLTPSPTLTGTETATPTVTLTPTTMRHRIYLPVVLKRLP